MEKDIGTKIIEAVPAYRCKDSCGKTVITQSEEDAFTNYQVAEEGYRVRYPDGYESWSPKDVFEEAYRKTDDMNFGLAIEAVKKGEKVARKGWNGKNQYVQLATNIRYMTFAKKIVNAEHSAIGNKALAFVGTSGIQLGWLASQADMLADDWYIV